MVLQDLYGGHLPTVQKIDEVKTVTGEALPVLVRLLISVEIAGGTYSCTFLIVRYLTHDDLLGRGFLRANGAVINLIDVIAGVWKFG